MNDLLVLAGRCLAEIQQGLTWTAMPLPGTGPGGTLTRTYTATGTIFVVTVISFEDPVNQHTYYSGLIVAEGMVVIKLSAEQSESVYTTARAALN